MNLIKSIFELKEEKENISIVKLADEKHPIFQAHFENNPILPAFVQIEILSLIFDLNIKFIKKAKFLSLIKPNDILIIKMQENKNSYNFKIFIKEELTTEVVVSG